MKLLFSFIIFILSIEICNGQELKVVSFKEKTTDLSASTNVRKDSNGDLCALVKVQLTLAGVQFGPNVMGTVDYKVNEYWVYLPTIAKHLKVQHSSFLTRDVTFSDYGINKLEPKTTYELILSLPNGTSSTQLVSSQYLVFNVEPKDAMVEVNGESWTNMGGTAHKYVPLGNYKYFVQSKDYNSASGSISVSDPNKEVVVNVKLKSTASGGKQQDVTTSVNVAKSIELQEGERGGIDKTGKVLFKYRTDDYDIVGHFKDGLAPVKKKGYYGYIDKTGKIVIPCQYSHAENFSEGLARVEKKGNYGYIDKTGKIVISCKYWEARNFSDGLAYVVINTSTHRTAFYIDKTGKKVLSLKNFHYRKIGVEFHEGLTYVQETSTFVGKWGFMDKTGRIVIPYKFDDVGHFSEGLAPVREGEFTGQVCNGYIDKTGKMVFYCQYRYLSSFSEGLARVRTDDLKYYGYIDKTGTIVIPCQYEDAGDFSEGLAFVRKENGEYGYIDKTGTIVIPCQYRDASDFSEGVACVQR